MKSAYELAMERLSRNAPARPVTPKQKLALAEVDSLYQSKLAQLELRTQDALATAEAAGDAEQTTVLRARFRQEKAQFEAERDAKKTAIRG